MRIQFKFAIILSTILFPLDGKSLPFSPDPVSFAGWLNQQNGKSFWYDRSMNAKFEYLGNCSYNYTYEGESYQCNVGYVTIKDSIRNQKCRVSIEYRANRQVSFSQSDCRDLTVKERSKRWIESLKDWLK